MFFPFFHSDSDDSLGSDDSDIEEIYHINHEIGPKRAREEEKNEMDPSKKKKYQEDFSQSQLYPFITFKLVESYTDDGKIPFFIL